MNNEYDPPEGYILAGIDIGGTKCAVSIAEYNKISGDLTIRDKISFETVPEPDKTIPLLFNALNKLIDNYNIVHIDSIGISCGSPLSSTKGYILAPPNLPLWVDVDIVTPFALRYKTKAKLQNDANAGALAEWKFGAGRGYDNIIFLTCGTGFGAGLILNGKLYAGKNDMAGEVGHIRAEKLGVLGYEKYGSYEGFCSGGGIARYAQMKIYESIYQKTPPDFCKTVDEIPNVTAKTVGEAAQNGDKFAIQIYKDVGYWLGMSLSMMIDLLNPEAIILGSIYFRQQNILEPVIYEVIEKECLWINRMNCKIFPAALREKIGDYAALSIAADEL